jgi:hypothetical protein
LKMEDLRREWEARLAALLANSPCE